MIRLKPQQYPQFAKQFWKEQTRWEMTDCCFDNPLEQGIFWVDRLEQPQCAAVLLGDFLFLQGKAAPSFLRQAAVKNGLLLMGEQDWLCCAKESFVKTKEYLRYRFDGSGLLQNQEKLRAWCNCLPEGMRLQKIDRGWFERCREKEWMRDFVSQYQALRSTTVQRVVGCCLQESNRSAVHPAILLPVEVLPFRCRPTSSIRVTDMPKSFPLR